LISIGKSITRTIFVNNNLLNFIQYHNYYKSTMMATVNPNNLQIGTGPAQGNPTLALALDV